MEKYDKKNLKIPTPLYSRIENDVVNLYLELNLTIPIEPKEVAKRLGYILKSMSSIKDKETQEFLRFDSLGKRRDGYSYFDPDISRFVIWVNDVDSFLFEHDRFTIMHEIGHIRLGHREESDLANMIANYYAGYSFVPSPLFSILGCRTKYDIIREFGVSPQCADICFRRCVNWVHFHAFTKPYEILIRDYYSHIINTEKMKEGD